MERDSEITLPLDIDDDGDDDRDDNQDDDRDDDRDNNEGDKEESRDNDAARTPSSTCETTAIPILPQDIYASDESGFTEATAVRQKVIGSRKNKIQHKTGGADRENTTVMVTICADGTAIPPLVIFKGKAFGVNWNENNPTKAS